MYLEDIYHVHQGLYQPMITITSTDGRLTDHIGLNPLLDFRIYKGMLLRIEICNSA